MKPSDITSYSQQGGAYFQQAWSAAADYSASTGGTGIPNQQAMFGAAVAIAAGAASNSQIVSDVMKIAASATASAISGSAMAVALFGAESAGPFGAMIGVIIVAFASLPPAHADNTDRRPVTWQAFDDPSFSPFSMDTKKNGPNPINERLRDQLLFYETTKWWMGTGSAMQGSNPTTQADVDRAFQALAGTYKAASPALGDGMGAAWSTASRFEQWASYSAYGPSPWMVNQYNDPKAYNLIVPADFGARYWFSPWEDPSFLATNLLGSQQVNMWTRGDIGIHARIAEAAVLGWDAATLYAYLIGLRAHWETAAIGAGLPVGDPESSTRCLWLDARIGYVSTLVPGLAAQPSPYHLGNDPSKWGTHITPPSPVPADVTKAIQRIHSQSVRASQTKKVVATLGGAGLLYALAKYLRYL